MKHRDDVGPGYPVSTLIPTGMMSDLDAVAVEIGYSRAAMIRRAVEQFILCHRQRTATDGLRAQTLCRSSPA
jgi:hypothetical protein